MTDSITLKERREGELKTEARITDFSSSQGTQTACGSFNPPALESDSQEQD